MADCLRITTLEGLSGGYGAHTWPCAPVLAQYVYSQRTDLKGKRVLELGAGTGVPGLVAAKCGAAVTLTDSPENSLILDNLKKTCALNGVPSVSVVGLPWGLFSPAALSLAPQDIILASDCFYDSSDFEDVLATVSFFMGKNRQCKCWVAYQERSSNRSLVHLMERWDINCVEQQLLHSEDYVIIEGPPRGSLNSISTVHLWELRHKTTLT